MLYDTQTSSWNVCSHTYGFCQDSQALQDPEAVFLKTASAARELAGNCSVDMILLSATWHGVLLCDENGRPETPVELWCYTGAADLCRTLRGDAAFAGTYYRTTGGPVNSTYPYFKLLEFRRQNRIKSSSRVGDQGVYNMFRLTGAWVTTQSMASGSGLLDVSSGQYAADLLASAGITGQQLPELAPYGKTFPLSASGAECIGQRAGIPVVPSYPDGALNQIGAGALPNGIMTFSVGTSAAIRMTTKDLLLPETPDLWSYLVPGAHLLGAATSGACNCQDWFKKSFFPPDTDYADIEKELSGTRDTPVFLPFLFGERCPGWNENREGGFERLRPEHSLSDMYQAVLEGILFNVYQCYQILVKTAGEPESIKLSGGILHSALWTRMCADIFGKTITVDKAGQSSLMGCAVIGLHLLGMLDSLEAFRPEPERFVEPDMAVRSRYMEKYSRYMRYYTALSGAAGQRNT